ncbi:MAG: 2-oxo acid dehydrogenase subunit E2 [Nanoarchaeota archaeon]
MAEFKFPDVGEGITEGKLVKWLVKQGDAIKPDQALAQVETDKAVVEIPSPVKGVLEKLLYAEGDVMQVGKPMLIYRDEGADASVPSPSAEKLVQTIVQLQQASSLSARHSDEVLALPKVRRIAQQRGIDLSVVPASGSHGEITVKDVEAFTGQSVVKETPLQLAARQDSREILATPSTRKLARELHVDIEAIRGSGDHGFITKDDVLAAANGPKPSVASTVTTQHLEASPAPLATQDEVVMPMSGIRQVIARKMMTSLQSSAQVTHTDEADVTELFAIREKEKELLKARGISLTFLPFFIKACVSALQQHPLLNAQVDDEGKRIILKKYYHLGIATDTEEGLVVPVIRNAEAKSIIALAKEIEELAAKARTKKLAPAEMSGGTFTISSVGSIGGGVFTPIINYPEVALLGIGRIRDRPVVKQGKIAIAKTVILSLSFDHRIIDGGVAARFVNSLITLLENPTLLFMELR